MQERVNSALSDADSTYFLALLFYGELVLKITTAAFVSAIATDANRHRYRLMHRIVRANGIGDWSESLADATTGPAATCLSEGLRTDSRAVGELVADGAWQYEAVAHLASAITDLGATVYQLPKRVSLKSWFAYFVELRNKTRGHGAITPEYCSVAAPKLASSISLVVENLPLFQREWVYLHRNLSGKYRVISLGQSATQFERLKSSSTESLSDGVYFFADDFHRVDLLKTTVDVRDFYLPNGSFTDKKFELLSYITDQRLEASSSEYLAPIGALPTSETDGIGRLEVIGQVFSNLPPRPESYVARASLESELKEILWSDRHQMVTLVGRGGVGKTSLAISVLHDIAEESTYRAVLWFSARDIDLLPAGPKIVRPSVLDERDVAMEFMKLVGPSAASLKPAAAEDFLKQQLASSELGPLLLVFDNFETVRAPQELYQWIDTYIRPPNKVLITSRFREFKGDYAVPVPGMTEHECEQLISQTASSLGIDGIITKSYAAELYREANGHPYVIKVLLGEVAKSKKLGKIERIIADRDEILDALFERTYAGLTPAAQRVFLVLCSWRSAIPEIALTAILLRPANELMDVEGALDELHRMSLVEIQASVDGSAFVTVPLSAMIFGRRKLVVSPVKAAVEADLALLRDFGAAQVEELRKGVGARVTRFFGAAASKVARGQAKLEDMLGILEYLARQYPAGSLLLSQMYEEEGRIDDARRCVERYLEREGDAEERVLAWKRLADLAHRQDNASAEMHAYVELAATPDIAFRHVSWAANQVNNLLRTVLRSVQSDEKTILLDSLVLTMSRRASEATATDLSRLAWLCVNMQDISQAKLFPTAGLELDPENPHLISLRDRLRYS